MTHRYLLLLVILLTLSVPAYSDGIVFIKLEPGNSFLRVASLFEGAATTGFEIVRTVPLTLSAFTPTQIGVGLTYHSGTNSATLTLDSSSGGLPDGTIESSSLTGLPPADATSILEIVIPVSPVSHSFRYPIPACSWPECRRYGRVLGRRLHRYEIPTAADINGGSFVPGRPFPGAFAVQDVAEVPEPTSLLLLAISIVGIGMALRRQVRRIMLDSVLPHHGFERRSQHECSGKNQCP